MDTCPIFTAVARDLQLDPELLLAPPEADAPAAVATGPQARR
ncbi:MULTISPECIES: hypothetical protein [unclassified Nocardioides]|nr:MULTISPECIES: hypothetical protein [unclassified Nocardioides]